MTGSREDFALGEQLHVTQGVVWQGLLTQRTPTLEAD